MTGLKVAGLVAMLSGFGLVVETVGQLTPGVPEDWKSWPATAILGFITLAALSVMTFSARAQGKGLVQTALKMERIATHGEETNRRLDEVAKKIGDTNTALLNLSTVIKARPCIMDDKALLKRLRRTQEIEQP